MLRVRLTPPEIAAITRAARGDVTAWARAVLLAAAGHDGGR